MARRGENIYKRKDGRWEGRILLKQSNGKSILHSVYAHSYSELKKKMKDMNTINHSTKLPSKNIEYYAEQWLQTVKLRCKQSTYSKYFNICKNHILPVLGTILADCLCDNDVYRLLSTDEDLSPKTINDILCVLKMICSFAASDGSIGNVHLKEISVRVPKNTVQVLSVEDQLRLVQYLLTDMDLIKLGVYLALCTGIRIGELCALQRKNIDLQNGLLHIGETAQRVQVYSEDTKTKVIVTEPKSECSIRDIPLTENIVTVFEPYLREMHGNAYILTGESKKIMEPNTVRYHFEKILKAVGIKKIKFHALRHSFATRCIESAVDVKTLSEILGHENVNITLDRYVHSSVELKREGMKKICCSVAYSPSNLSSRS